MASAQERRLRRSDALDLASGGTKRTKPQRLSRAPSIVRAFGHAFGMDFASVPTEKAADKAHRKALRGTRTPQPPKRLIGT